MSKVSVIIPTYNRAQYIAEAIDSVLNQTYQDFEIIIVDDGSTDNTKEIIKPYLDDYSNKIRYFYQKNKGISAARNMAINKAREDYIAFLDSDDRWLPEKLEKQMKVIKDENINFVYSAMYVENNGRMTNRIIPANPATDFLGLLTKNQSIAMATTIIKKEYITKTGMFDETLTVSVDYDLWLRVLLKYKVKYLKEPLTIYREHADNITKNIENVKKSGIVICQKLLKNSEIPKKIIKRKLSSEHYMLGKIYYDKKQYKNASTEIKNAIYAYPFVGNYFFSPQEKLKNKIIKLIKPYCIFLYLLFLKLWGK